MASPVLQALLVADHVYQDRQTGKHIICGIFGRVFFTPNNELPGISDDAMAEAQEGDGSKEREFPIEQLLRAGSPFAYVSLTEIMGQKQFELRYVDLRENAVMFRTEFNLEGKDPLATIQITIALPQLPAPHEGVFALELLCENELLGAHRIQAVHNPKT